MAPDVLLSLGVEDCVMYGLLAHIVLVEHLLERIERDEAVHRHSHIERDPADLEEREQVIDRVTIGIENHHILGEVEIELRAEFFDGLVAQLKQENGLAAVQVEAVDAVDAQAHLVHEAWRTCLLQELLE